MKTGVKITGMFGYSNDSFNTDFGISIPKDWKIVGYLTDQGSPLYIIFTDENPELLGFNFLTKEEVIIKIIKENRKNKLYKINENR